MQKRFKKKSTREHSRYRCPSAAELYEVTAVFAGSKSGGRDSCTFQTDAKLISGVTQPAEPVVMKTYGPRQLTRSIDHGPSSQLYFC